MIRILPLLFIIVVGLIGTQAQENLNRDTGQFAASVLKLKGVCYVRDGETSQPRPLKLKDQLRAGQGVSCNRGAHLRILFYGSNTEKDVKATLPKWLVILNTMSTLKRQLLLSKSSREKSGLDGTSVPTATQQIGRLNPVPQPAAAVYRD